MKIVKRAWQAAPVAVVILAGALLAAAFFTVRGLLFWIYWSDPAHRDQQIAGWMTPRYVALSWDIPREVMIDLVGLPRGEGRPQSIAQIAAELGLTTEAFIDRLETGIAAYRSGLPDGGDRP